MENIILKIPIKLTNKTTIARYSHHLDLATLNTIVDIDNFTLQDGSVLALEHNEKLFWLSYYRYSGIVSFSFNGKETEKELKATLLKAIKTIEK